MFLIVTPQMLEVSPSSTTRCCFIVKREIFRLKVKIQHDSFNKSLKSVVTWFYDVFIILLESLNPRWQCFLAVSLLLFWTVSDCLLLNVSYVTLWLLQSHKGTSDKTAEEASLGSDSHSLETSSVFKLFSEHLTWDTMWPPWTLTWWTSQQHVCFVHVVTI